MSIYLHNPGHNGDVLCSSEIVKILVRSNPTIRFKIVPSCSSILFEDVASDNVSINEHPVAWMLHKNEVNPIIDDNIQYIRQLHDTLISFHNGNLYMNMWAFFINEKGHSMELRERHTQMKRLLQEIKNTYNIDLQFHCDDYHELIPKIPQFDTDFMNSFLDPSKYKETILFYNLNGYSGQDESRYSASFNDNFIKHLLDENPDSQVIIVNETTIKHPNLLTLTTDVKIEKTLSGKSLVLYANICRLCDKVYLKLNGGSLFVLNKDNINDTSTEYYLLYDMDDGADGYSEILPNVYNKNIRFIGGYKKYN